MVDHICDSTSNVGRILPLIERASRWGQEAAYCEQGFVYNDNTGEAFLNGKQCSNAQGA
jgi:hypothetical protein